MNKHERKALFICFIFSLSATLAIAFTPIVSYQIIKTNTMPYNFEDLTDEQKGIYLITSAKKVIKLDNLESTQTDTDEPDYRVVNLGMGKNYPGISPDDITEDEKIALIYHLSKENN